MSDLLEKYVWGQSQWDINSDATTMDQIREKLSLSSVPNSDAVVHVNDMRLRISHEELDTRTLDRSRPSVINVTEVNEVYGIIGANCTLALNRIPLHNGDYSQVEYNHMRTLGMQRVGDTIHMRYGPIKLHKLSIDRDSIIFPADIIDFPKLTIIYVVE